MLNFKKNIIKNFIPKVQKTIQKITLQVNQKIPKLKAIIQRIDIFVRLWELIINI
jgi:hypothetical protein